MFDKFYVCKLADSIISDQPLSCDQLYFLVDIAADYIYEHYPDCFFDINCAKLSLMDKAFNRSDDDGMR